HRQLRLILGNPKHGELPEHVRATQSARAASSRGRPRSPPPPAPPPSDGWRLPDLPPIVAVDLLPSPTRSALRGSARTAGLRAATVDPKATGCRSSPKQRHKAESSPPGTEVFCPPFLSARRTCPFPSTKPTRRRW